MSDTMTDRLRRCGWKLAVLLAAKSDCADWGEKKRAGGETMLGLRGSETMMRFQRE